MSDVGFEKILKALQFIGNQLSTNPDPENHAAPPAPLEMIAIQLTDLNKNLSDILVELRDIAGKYHD